MGSRQYDSLIYHVYTRPGLSTVLDLYSCRSENRPRNDLLWLLGQTAIYSILLLSAERLWVVIVG